MTESTYASIEGLQLAAQPASDTADALPTAGTAVSRAGDLWLLDRPGGPMWQRGRSCLYGAGRAETRRDGACRPAVQRADRGNVSGLGGVKYRDFMMAAGRWAKHNGGMGSF